jgi:hypothetical protein
LVEIDNNNNSNNNNNNNNNQQKQWQHTLNAKTLFKYDKWNTHQLRFTVKTFDIHQWWRLQFYGDNGGCLTMSLCEQR